MTKTTATAVLLATASLALIAASVTTTFGQTAQSAGQTAPSAHKWQVGEIVEVYAANKATRKYEWKRGVVKDVMDWGGAHVICDDQPDYVETVGNFTPEWVNATPPRIGEARYLGYKRGPLTTQEKAQTAGACPCDPGIRDPTPAGASQTVRFKHLIWEYHNASVNGTLTAPVKVGVTFDTFNIGAPQPNKFGYLGNGVHGLDYSTAKQGESIYPVSTRFTLWRQYGDKTLTQTQYDGHFACFKEKKSGAWVCTTAPGHQQIGSTH